MVLDTLLDPKQAENHPFKMFVIGIVYSSFALVLSYLIFKNYSSILMVAFTAIVAVPLMHSILQQEESKEKRFKTEIRILKEHEHAIIAFTFMFLGFLVSFLMWNLVLPSGVVEHLFSAQIETANIINTGGAVYFGDIFFNNLRVLMFCMIFSFFYGAGAIFILTWNASIISAVIGSFIRSHVAGATGMGAYATATGLGIHTYALHGIPEIIGFYVAGLAGGILSVAIINHEFGTRHYYKIMWDSANLLVLSIIIIALSTAIEVFITPGPV